MQQSKAEDDVADALKRIKVLEKKSFFLKKVHNYIILLNQKEKEVGRILKYSYSKQNMNISVMSAKPGGIK